MFSYYAQWFPQFSEKINPLLVEKQFPLSEEAQQALTSLKEDLTSATLRVINENLPFVIETDASENAISASLNQENRPVAFFSRMLNKNEMSHSSVKKEASATVRVTTGPPQKISTLQLGYQKVNSSFL